MKYRQFWNDSFISTSISAWYILLMNNTPSGAAVNQSSCPGAASGHCVQVLKPRARRSQVLQQELNKHTDIWWGAWSSEDNYWLFPKHIHDIWNLLVWSHYHLNRYKCCHLFTLMLFKSCMTSISFFHKSKGEIVYQSWIFPSMKVTCGYQKTLIKKTSISYLVFLPCFPVHISKHS